jgi:hypothetical protein
MKFVLKYVFTSIVLFVSVIFFFTQCEYLVDEIEWPVLNLIVISDTENNRVVQIDDMSGTGWTALNGSDLGGEWTAVPLGPSHFRPWDVDVDPDGRIYIANNYGGSGIGANRVVRIDDITGANLVLFNDPEDDYGIVALAVDWINNYVYYAASDFTGPNTSPLFRSDMDGNNAENLDVGTGVDEIMDIRGMAVDMYGILYIAGISGGVERIFRYDTALQSVTHTYADNLNQVGDVLYKPNNLYVANRDGSDPYKILMLDPDSLTLTGNYGSAALNLDTPTPGTDAGTFYGPFRFTATLNRKLYILDFYDRFGNPDIDDHSRLVSIEDIVGTGWETYGQTGSAVGEFSFFTNYAAY